MVGGSEQHPKMCPVPLGLWHPCEASVQPWLPLSYPHIPGIEPMNTLHLNMLAKGIVGISDFSPANLFLMYSA